jgi:hypothetical protein
MRGAPVDITATFRFPFREPGELDHELHSKFRRVEQLITNSPDVADTYYEEDEQYGLFVEVTIPMDSPLMTVSMQELYDKLWASLSTLYAINECR